MYDHDDVPSEFKYPQRDLARVGGMLIADEINNPNSKNLVEDTIRHVIKCGVTTNTTVGTMSKFESHIHWYLSLDTPRDSVEVTILPYGGPPGPFSRGRDSRALIIDALFKFVALLSGETGNTDLSDITYGTLFKWIQDLIEERFLGADLYFGNTKDFFNDKD